MQITDPAAIAKLYSPEQAHKLLKLDNKIAEANPAIRLDALRPRK
jgi:hypothetical protein